MKNVTVLAIGVVQPENGKTCYDWNMYDSMPGVISLTSSGFLMYHANENDFTPGDQLQLIANDSNRKLKTATIVESCSANREDVLAMLLRNQYDYYPARAFKKKRFSRKLSTSYSVKGIYIS
jgi:hypothetical protein